MAGSLQTLLGLQSGALPFAAGVNPRARVRGTASVSPAANAVVTLDLTMPLTPATSLNDRDGYWFEHIAALLSGPQALTISSVQLTLNDSVNNIILPYGQPLVTTLSTAGGLLTLTFPPPFNPVSRKDMDIFTNLQANPVPLRQPLQFELQVRISNGSVAQTVTATLFAIVRKLEGLSEV